MSNPTSTSPSHTRPPLTKTSNAAPLVNGHDSHLITVQLQLDPQARIVLESRAACLTRRGYADRYMPTMQSIVLTTTPTVMLRTPPSNHTQTAMVAPPRRSDSDLSKANLQYDTSSGQVYSEAVIAAKPGKSRKDSLSGAILLPRLGKVRERMNYSGSAPSLETLAIHSVFENIESLDVDSLEFVPWPIKKRLWYAIRPYTFGNPP